MLHQANSKICYMERCDCFLNENNENDEFVELMKQRISTFESVFRLYSHNNHYSTFFQECIEILTGRHELSVNKRKAKIW